MNLLTDSEKQLANNFCSAELEQYLSLENQIMEEMSVIRASVNSALVAAKAELITRGEVTEAK